MLYTVVLRFDPAATCPRILHGDSQPLAGGDGVRYRLVAQTDGPGEALRVADQLWRRINPGQRWTQQGLALGE